MNRLSFDNNNNRFNNNRVSYIETSERELSNRDTAIANNGNFETAELQVLTDSIDQIIKKEYLNNITINDVEPLEASKRTFNNIRLFEIEKLVYDKTENINDKLISVYSGLQNSESTLILIIHSKDNKIKFYIGVQNSKDCLKGLGVLEKSLNGNFPGSILSLIRKNNECETLMNDICLSNRDTKNVSSVTIVPATRDKDKEKFVQGIEKFIDTMKGQDYSAIFIAEPLTHECLDTRKAGLEELYSSLSPYAKTNLTYGINCSRAVNTGTFRNVSHSVNNSVTNGTSRNSSVSNGTTEGEHSGGNMNFGGFGFNRGRSRSRTQTFTQGQTWTNSVTSGTADTNTDGTTDGITDTEGESRTIALEHQNKSIITILEKIDNNIKRYNACEAFGVWECAAYFLSTDISVSNVAANTFKALMQGEETDVEGSYINVWDYSNMRTPQVLDYLKYLNHPVMLLPTYIGNNQDNRNNNIIKVTPTSVISGKELPIFIGFPRKSVPGLSVFNIAEFGRNVYVNNHLTEYDATTDLKIGHVNHMGVIEEISEVCINKNNLASHCLITGATGSGKSYTTYLLLEKMIQNKIPFLVIEPAKGEYKDVFGGLPNINIFTTNPFIGQMLKLNPFKFDLRIHILEHLDRIIEIFKACWEMYAAMPAILKDAIETIYVKAGWDLINSVYVNEGPVKFPTFLDLLNELPKIIDSSRYSSDTKGDYVGALVTRVASLTNGFFGQIFCDCYDIDDDVLFDQNTIIDLSRVGSSETKSLIMGIIVTRLNEYRMVSTDGPNSQLKHVTVLEEAHNLLKRTNLSQDGSNVVAKSVEMICNSIAEMRSYGEGFMIVDQSPMALDIAAIKNTNTKFIMRLLEKDDCEAAGKSIGLNELQIAELAKLNTGVAVVMQNNWQEAVLTKIDRYPNRYERKINAQTNDAMTR